MRLIKDCPRCKGDMFVDRDRYGWHKQCLQCGYLVDFAKTDDGKQNPPIEEKENKLIKTT